jgi:acetyltransferase
MDADEQETDRADYAELTRVNNKPIVVFGRTHQNVMPNGRALQRSANVPFLQGIPDAIRALQKSVEYASAFRRGVPRVPTSRARLKEEGLGIKELLSAYGIELPKQTLLKTAGEAAAAASSIGYPVALKIVSPQASHKTEVGGVALDLKDAHQVEGRAQAMLEQLRTVHPAAIVDGFLVQEMVSGVEMIVGARSDPLFGPVIVAGFGGITAELLKDVSIRLAPISEESALDMFTSLRGAALLDEFRGRPACDLAALAHAVAALSQLYCDNRDWISEIEINPLMVRQTARGVRAVDVRVVRVQ